MINLNEITKHYYTIISIVHSGRKGLRGTECKEPKYDGLVGCSCTFADNPIRGKSVRLILKDHYYWEWWTLSMVLGVAIEEDKFLIIETENSIYKFEIHK